MYDTYYISGLRLRAFREPGFWLLNNIHQTNRDSSNNNNNNNNSIVMINIIV